MGLRRLLKGGGPAPWKQGSGKGAAHRPSLGNPGEQGSLVGKERGAEGPGGQVVIETSPPNSVFIDNHS